MATHDDDDANKRGEEGEKRCFDLFATLLHAFGNDEIRARRGKEEQERNMLMIHTIITAATNTFLLGHKRNIDDDEFKNQENTSSSSSSRSLVESKRRRVVVSDNKPIRAEPIREIKPPVKEINRTVKRKEPVRREPVVTPGWVIDLMRKKNGEDAKMIFEKVMTKTDLTPNQGRLLMPFNQMSEMDFMTEAELKILEEHHKDKGDANKKRVNDYTTEKKKGVDVILLNRNGNKKWNLNMRIWEMRSSFNYALCTGWNQVVRDNKLKVNQTITLWSFHSHDGKLYFAFDPPTPVTHSASSSGDPFACEEANRRIMLYWSPKRSRATGVWILDPRSNLLEGSDLNRTVPPPEDTEMDSDLEDAHIRRHSTMVEHSSNPGSGCNQRFM
ncbi:unnamed protein product [Eruca vesicaria subsp. sativa]|uniref:TF-B3 domain-containing protein n=1 Tax=Eruca vesicaria subsp. sativa TaxID=29727 RepID=A0ABC8JAA9_ERUVS|nr:unnamed protein product [Eruca vesicaria subsp. sativa]